MTICRIKVENVKGAKCHDIAANIIANKPSLLVAPNGFGKSSITAAFSSLIPSKLKLDDDGSMPFCVELDNLKDTDAPIHQPAAMLVAAD